MDTANLARAFVVEFDDIARVIAAACAQLSKNKIGALIAVEREIGLAGLVEQGVKLDATLTPELLNTIFWPGSGWTCRLTFASQRRLPSCMLQSETPR